MKRIRHPFFEHLNDISRRDLWNLFEGVKFPRREFLSALREAHPIVFDAHCTEEGISKVGLEIDSIIKIPDVTQKEMFQKQLEEASLVKEFSLPFATSLYLLTDCPTVIRHTPNGQPFVYKRLGVLLKELGSPEKIRVFDLMAVKTTTDKIFKAAKVTDEFIPVLDFFDIDLKNLDPNLASDTISINRFTNMMSVKRVGIEKNAAYTLKTKDIGIGFTTFKYDNIIHIADKEEYEYTTPLSDGEINFEYAGWWRGHWRAFYFPKSMTDAYGRRLVDYERIGKNREGIYNVPGYTWVMEHSKGDPALAEIKTRTVKHED